MNPASDYDVLVVYSDLPVPISLILTTIGQRLAEVVFFSADTIKKSCSIRAVNPLSCPISGILPLFGRWARSNQAHLSGVHES